MDSSFQFYRRPLHFSIYLMTWVVAAVLRALPRSIRGEVGAAIGYMAYFIGIRRKVTINNIVSAFPEMPRRAIREFCARTYRHFGSVAAEFAALPRLRSSDKQKWVFIENPEVLEQTVSEGKGCIVFAGHLGNWELMGSISAHSGLPVSFVVTTQRNKLVERMIDDYRRKAGIEIIKRREAVRGVLSALKRNRIVAILIDQDAHEEGAFVPFFGRLASTPRGPAVFHLRTGAPLVFAQSIRLPGGQYRIKYRRLPEESESDADVLTAKMTARLEQAIRENPEQWLWMHKRWKTRPTAS